MSVSTILTSKRTISAIVCSLSIAAMAATPVAVWDGDFTTLTKGTFTLSENGNTKTDSYLQISGDNGITVTSTDALNVFTVIMRCEGLNLSSANKQVLFTSYARDEVASNGTDYKNLTGVNLPANNAVCRGIWSAADWNDGATQGSVPANYTTLIYNHQQTNGTYGYALGPTSSEDETVVRTTLYSVVGLRSSGTTYHGFNIGGLRGTTSSTLLPATGLKITSIAVFSGTLTESEMKAYFFPSEIQQKAISVEANTTLSAILAETGITSEASARTSLTLTATDNPTITIDQSVSLYSLTINGAAMVNVDSSLYDDGCFKKTIVGAVHGGISAADATFTANCNAWKGALKNTGTALELYAQNTETISINIGGGRDNTTTVQPSPNDNLVSGSDYVGLYPAPGAAWNNISGHWTGGAQTVTLTGAKAFDGETTIVRNTVSLSGTANNTWAVGTSYESFLRGYLDDSGSVAVQIVGIPYSAYDVIIYATSDSSLALNYFTVNGVNYTCGSDGVAVVGTDAWGVGQTTTAALGKNAMLVKNVTGSTLSVTGTRAANSGPRVTVCAVQIVNKGTVEASDWTANLTASTDFDGGNGSGLSDQSGTWTDNALATMIITNTAASATLTFDGDLTAGTFKAVGGEGKCLVLDKGGDANLDITVYDLTETVEETVFNFNPGFDKVSSGGNYVGVGYAYSGNIASPLHFREAGNTLTLTTVSGGKVDIGGSGTLSGTLELLADAEVRISGTYTSQNEQTSLRATKGVLTIAEGADVSVPYVQLVNSSDSSQACTLNIGGRLAVTSTSTGSDVYSERLNFKGILLGHYYGSCAVNVLQGGSLIGENAWLQMTYTAPTVLTINGGSVKVRGINAAVKTDRASDIVLTGGGTLEIAEGFVNTATYTNKFGYGTVKTYSYGGSDGWTHPGAVAFTDSVNGTVIDPCGMTNVFSGALSGAGKIVVSDSVGGGSVSFTGDANDLSGDIVVAANTTLNLGTARPTGTMTVNGTLAVVLINKADVPVFKVSANPVSVILYDTDGETVLSGASVTYDAEAGTITVHPPINTWNVASNLAFDTAGNWSYGLPESTQDTAIKVTGDAALTIAGTYAAATLTVSGNGVVEFSGEGSFTVGTLYLNGGATLAPNSKIIATSIVLDGGTVLRLKDRTESASISGAGAVETYGSVKFAADNTFTGGLTVNLGSIARTTVQQGFGKNNYGQAIANLSRIVVLDGGSLDLANTVDACYAITISGKGVCDAQSGIYKGALYNSGPEIGQGKRQTASLTLAADAMVRAEASTNGWGIVNSGHAASVLALNGHTLTVSGAGYFPIDNANTASGTQTTGTLIADGVTLGLVSTASNLTGVDVIAKGCATINLAVAPSALGSLTISPTASGTTASNWNLPTTCVPVVNTANVDPSGLSAGQSVVLFTDTNEHLEYNSNIVWQVGGRFEGHNDAHEVTATYAAGIPQPFLHYDFNNGAADDTGKASDSKYQISIVDEASSVTLVNSRNWKAVQVHTGYTPYWSSSTAGISSFHAGEATVATVARLKETGIILWGLGNNDGSNTALGLVAPTATSAAVIMRNPDGTITTLATVSDTDDLTKGWHLFVVVADANGTTFYVDKQKATSAVPAATAIGQQGQLGSFYSGAATGYNKAGTNGDGYLLDDWRVYDAALTAKEIKALKRELNPDPLFIRLR